MFKRKKRVAPIPDRDRCVVVDPTHGNGGQEWCQTHNQIAAYCRDMPQSVLEVW